MAKCYLLSKSVVLLSYILLTKGLLAQIGNTSTSAVRDVQAVAVDSSHVTSNKNHDVGCGFRVLPPKQSDTNHYIKVELNIDKIAGNIKNNVFVWLEVPCDVSEIYENKPYGMIGPCGKDFTQCVIWHVDSSCKIKFVIYDNWVGKNATIKVEGAYCRTTVDSISLNKLPLEIKIPVKVIPGKYRTRDNENNATSLKLDNYLHHIPVNESYDSIMPILPPPATASKIPK